MPSPVDTGRYALLNGALHRLDDRPLRWWEKLLGRKRTQWVPVESDFKG